MAEQRLKVCCTKCGSEDIRERNVAYAELRVLAWERDGDLVMPADYDSDESADWECEDTEYQYVCRGCGHRMRIDQLTGEEVDDV